MKDHFAVAVNGRRSTVHQWTTINLNMTFYLYVRECRHQCVSPSTTTTTTTGPTLCKSSVIWNTYISVTISYKATITLLYNTCSSVVIIRTKAIRTPLYIYTHLMNNRLWTVDLHPSMHKCIIVYHVPHNWVQAMKFISGSGSQKGLYPFTNSTLLWIAHTFSGCIVWWTYMYIDVSSHTRITGTCGMHKH